jgi:D-alanine--poly(phosphoribitol) ligase subunit 2
VENRPSWSGLSLRDPERDPADAASPTGCPLVGGPSADADDVASALTAFVNTHIMARSRPIQPEDDLEAAGVDSMGLLKILLFVEAQFGFWMPDADLRAENVSSLRTLAAYVSRRRSQA